MHPAIVFGLIRLLFGLSFGAHATVYGPFLVSIGLSVSQVFWVNVFFAGAIMLGEVPTGMLADKRGRGWSVRMGVLCWALASALYLCAVGFWTAALSEGIAGIGHAFISGSLNAWVTDAMDMRGADDRRARVFGNGFIAHRIGLVAGGLVGAWVGDWSLRATWALSAVMLLLALVVCRVCMGDRGECAGREHSYRALFIAARSVVLRPDMRWLVLLCVCCVLWAPMNYFWSIWFQGCTGLSRVGWIWVLIQVGMFAGAWLVKRLKGTDSRGDQRRLLIGFSVASASLPLLALAGCHAAAYPILFLDEAARGAYGPLEDSYVQGRAEKSNGATVESMVSLVTSFGNTVAIILIGAATYGMPISRASIAAMWIVSGALALACAAAFWAHYFLKRR